MNKISPSFQEDLTQRFQKQHQIVIKYLVGLDLFISLLLYFKLLVIDEATRYTNRSRYVM